MIEIIPNWHPIFVHFTIALFSVAFLLLILSYLFSLSRLKSSTFVFELEIVGRWCLWMAAILVIPTLIAGFYAYYTVQHDEISHRVMTTHRNLALITGVLILLIAVWSLLRHIWQKRLNIIFIISLVITQSLLLATAWHGAELVFRYGLGVMSLPQMEKMQHHH